MAKIEERSEFKTMVQVGKISCNLLHDLISPITGLGLYLETIEDEGLKELLTPLKDSHKNIKDFIGLIQDAVENPEHEQEIMLIRDINHAVSLGQHKALRQNVSIEIKNRVKKDILTYCRRLEVYQLIMNLVGNAVDSFEGIERNKKTVLITIHKNRRNLIINVLDNGCGISKENLSRIFNKSFTTKDDGMGIGLNTVQKIVEQSFQGQIGATSRLTKGTRFSIKIPLTSKIFYNQDF
jgi:signal transduction histidine kinase